MVSGPFAGVVVRPGDMVGWEWWAVDGVDAGLRVVSGSIAVVAVRPGDAPGAGVDTGPWMVSRPSAGVVVQPGVVAGAGVDAGTSGGSYVVRVGLVLDIG